MTKMFSCLSKADKRLRQVNDRFRDVIEATHRLDLGSGQRGTANVVIRPFFRRYPVIILTTGLGGTCWISSTSDKILFPSLAAESADEQ
ncbi:Uncharacterised protein [Kluyvera cryocrescens]|uniref:Uncharacterized protein n=1 Tax=Kluyvera cryocrescens TaxID=580 RepID=A0A485BYA8_KLUCR|nr:Uncharacterised protein [Kluyvera cryocrescens]